MCRECCDSGEGRNYNSQVPVLTRGCLCMSLLDRLPWECEWSLVSGTCWGCAAGRKKEEEKSKAVTMDIFGDLRRMNKRQLYYQVLNFAMIVSSALMIWKGLIVITGSESPIVVVLSGSMEPAFHRGDLLFLTNFRDDPIRAGEIVVFKVEGRDIPIVHRVIKVHEKENGNIKFLTKGDNNEVDDRGLYKEGQNWLEKKDVVGRARGFLPYVGMVTIIMNDYPKFKNRFLAGHLTTFRSTKNVVRCKLSSLFARFEKTETGVEIVFDKSQHTG
ncbi:UNVERIFIED_CONTAM: Signal peptidase complex catalytic subunit S11C [Gekko kuhli]